MELAPFVYSEIMFQIYLIAQIQIVLVVWLAHHATEMSVLLCASSKRVFVVLYYGFRMTYIKEALAAVPVNRPGLNGRAFKIGFVFFQG